MPNREHRAMVSQPPRIEHVRSSSRSSVALSQHGAVDLDGAETAGPDGRLTSPGVMTPQIGCEVQKASW